MKEIHIFYLNLPCLTNLVSIVLLGTYFLLLHLYKFQIQINMLDFLLGSSKAFQGDFERQLFVIQ